MLIELHSGKLPASLNLVRPCLLRVGWRLGHRSLTSFDNADAPDSQYGRSDNCYNKDVSFFYKLLLFRNVGHFPSLSPRQR
jgi:hypothetical protein